MNQFTRNLCYLGAAAGLHAAVLFGVSYGGDDMAYISSAESGPDPTEVALVENADDVEEVTAPEPMPEQPPTPPEPEPMPVEPPPVEPPPVTPPEPAPPEEMATPEPTPEPAKEVPKPEPKPEPKPKPAPKPAPKPTPRPAAMPSTRPGPPTQLGSSQGVPGGPQVRPGAGDNGRVSWRNRVKPAYPPSAKAAGIEGRVVLQLSVNAAGQLISVRVAKSSGNAALDQAALSAARASTFNPKRIGGVPMSDTIAAPYTFDLN